MSLTGPTGPSGFADINDSIVSMSGTWSSYKQSNNLTNIFSQIQSQSPFSQLSLYNSLTLPTTGYYNPYDLCFFSNSSQGSLQNYCAVLLYHSGAIDIINVTDQKNPFYVSSVLAPSNGLAPQSICTDGSGFLYTVGQYHYINCYNCSNAANVTSVGSLLFDTGSTSDYQCSYGTISGSNYVFVSCNVNGFAIIDVSNPSTPLLAYQQGSTKCAGMSTVFQTNYVCNVTYQTSGFTTSNLQIWNVSTPTAPTLTIFALPLTSGTVEGTTCQVFGNTCVVADSHNNVLILIDITIPTSPTTLCQIPLSSGLSGASGKIVSIIGNIMYVNLNISSICNIYAYDIINRSSPVFLTSYNTGYTCRSILAYNNFIYCANINGSNPAILQSVSTLVQNQIVDNLTVNNVNVLSGIITNTIVSGQINANQVTANTLTALNTGGDSISLIVADGIFYATGPSTSYPLGPTAGQIIGFGPLDGTFYTLTDSSDKTGGYWGPSILIPRDATLVSWATNVYSNSYTGSSGVSISLVQNGILLSPTTISYGPGLDGYVSVSSLSIPLLAGDLLEGIISFDSTIEPVDIPGISSIVLL